MFFKNSIHFLDNARKKAFLMCESKLVYMDPHGPEKSPKASESKETKSEEAERKAKLEKVMGHLKSAESYKKGFDKYIKKSEYELDVKDKMTPASAKRDVEDIVSTIEDDTKAAVKKTKDFQIFKAFLTADLKASIGSNMSKINEHIPIKIIVGPRSFVSFQGKGYDKTIDLQLHSPNIQRLEAQKRTYEQAREKRDKGKEAVRKSTTGKLGTMRKGIDPSKEFEKTAMTKSPYLKKKGDIYVVDFKGKGKRIDRKAEKTTQIQDLLDLSRLKGGDMYVRIHLDGVSRAGVRHKYWAYYHPSQGTFIKEGTTDRALIFHGTKISQIQYKVREPKVAKMPTAAPKKKAAPQKTERQRKLERKFKILQADWDKFYGKEAYVMQNKKFKVPATLQDDGDFEKYWGRISRPLEATLTRDPFNLTTPKARREYMQKVIQGEGVGAAFDYNDNLYAQDFFETKLNGKDLYKGGYKQFTKDFYSVDKEIAELGMDPENPQNDKERKLANKWKKIESIAFGLSKIFDALGRSSTIPKSPETSADKYRTRFVGLKTLTAKEKEKLGTLHYHSLESLLHTREKAKGSGIDIGINTDLTTEIKGQVIDQEVPGLKMSELLKDKGGLKLMFMAFGLNNLIKKGCIKRLDDKHYVVVRIPTRGWAEALGTIAQNGAKLHDPSEENFKKWEAVRASFDQGRQSRNFILKIFKPSGSQVTQNISWWKKLMHWDFKDKKKVSMAYLGKATLDPKMIEKHIATDRGYLDMMEKTSKRVEGTSLYEPKKSEVLRLTNQYLEYGLLATFMNANPKDLPKITDQLLKDFNIEGKVTLKKPLSSKENRLANLDAIKNAITINDVDPSKLTKAHIRLIQMGYVLGRQVETAASWSEVMEKNLSTKPLYRKIQLKALQDGCPVYKLKEIEQRVHIALFGLSQSMTADGVTKFRMKGGGIGASIKLGEWGNTSWNLNLALAGSDGKILPFAGIGTAIKLGGGVRLRFDVGSTIGFTGVSTALEFPITSEWDMYIGAGAGISWKGAQAGVGASIGAMWNKKRAEKVKETKALSERGVKSIDKAISSGNVDKAAELILKNPTFGDYVKAIKLKFKNPKNPKGLPNAVVVDIYQNARTEWLNAARRGVKIPAVTGFGVGVFAGTSGLTLGAYVTFKIPGTTVNYVIRHEHPKYSEYVQSQVAEVDLRKKLEKKGVSKPVVSSYSLSASTGIVYFDSRLGRGHVARPNGTSEMKQSIAVKEKGASASLEGKGSFAAIKRTFANLDMHVEMVADPKNPKQHLLAITPLQTEGSNVEMLIDPELKSKGIILDKTNNRILLAASEAKHLYVTRAKYRYPYERKGAMNLEVIAFKTRADRGDMEIREDSPHYIYKYAGEKYAMVRGEARTGIAEGSSNTMTLEQYKQRKASYETFKDRKLDVSYRQAQGLTTKMAEAVGVKEQPPTRFKDLKLGEFTDSVFKHREVWFEKNIGKADTLAKEAAFKAKFFSMTKSDFKDYAKKVLKKPELELNDQELNLIYTYMLNESFVKLAHRSDEVVNRRLKKRNELFRAHVKKYVGDFAKENPEAWKQIQAIDPSVSPDSIANYLMLTMPQNAKQFREFLKKKQLPLGEGLKFASYTRKYKNEAFATSYGMQMPGKFKDIFKMVGPTQLKLDSPNPRERAAARLILQVMSPLSTKNLETVDGKKKFLESELSLLVISMYDGKTGISPMVEVLGQKNYQGMIAIYKALKEGGLATAINNNPQAFDQFKTLIMGLRQAQLNAEPTFVFKNKYVFHLKKTEVYSGAYLKCGNGTIAARQQIGLSIKREQAGGWTGAKTERNISVIPNERLGAKMFTLGWAHTHKAKRTPKDEPPNRHKEPPKGETPGRHTTAKGDVPNTGGRGTGSTTHAPEGPGNSA